MPNYEKKDWILLKDFVKKGNSLNFEYDDDEDKVYVTLNGNTKINIEHDVECFIARIFREEKTLDKTALICLANHSYIVYKRKVDRYNNPIILRCNIETGQMTYLPWEPYLVFVSNVVFTINDTHYENDERYIEYCKRIKDYCKQHVYKRNKSRQCEEDDEVFYDDTDWAKETWGVMTEGYDDDEYPGPLTEYDALGF